MSIVMMQLVCTVLTDHRMICIADNAARKLETFEVKLAVQCIAIACFEVVA